jgi:hypothetical protein
MDNLQEQKYTDAYSEEKMRKYLRHSVGPFGRLNTITLVKQNANRVVTNYEPQD